MADRFGAKMLFGGGVACTAILTIVTEPVANWGFGWMVALRVIGNGLLFYGFICENTVEVLIGTPLIGNFFEKYKMK